MNPHWTVPQNPKPEKIHLLSSELEGSDRDVFHVAKICHMARRIGEPFSQEEIKEATGLGSNDVNTAVSVLARNGYVTVETGDVCTGPVLVRRCRRPSHPGKLFSAIAQELHVGARG